MCKFFRLSFLTAIFAIALVSCKKETVINVNGITIVLPSGTGTSLNVGSSITVTATVTPADATNKGVTLTSSNSAVISVTETASGWTIKAESIGTATLTAKAKDEGGKTITLDLTVTAISGNLTVTVSGSYTYNGAPITPPAANVTVKLGEATLTAADYTLTYSDNTNAGTAAKVTATGKGNYSGTGSGTFTIAKCPISVKANDMSKTIGDVDPAFTYTPTPALFGSDVFTGALTRTAGETVGDYDILQGTLSAGNNYAITFTPGKFTIKAPLQTLAQRIAAAASGDIIQLYADENIASTITINKTITLISSVTTPEGIRTIGNTVPGYMFSLTAGGNLTLDTNVTLDGSGVVNNNAPLVFVGANAVFTMKAGSKITGNNNINSNASSIPTYGDGVLVFGNSASFVMLGGEITNNHGEIGGAISVVLGAFTMSGGKVIGNTSKYGGDMTVFIYYSTPATFYLSGDAQIGDLMLFSGGTAKPLISLADNFTGSIANLDFSCDGGSTIAHWANAIVVKPAEGSTLTKALLDKFPLRNFLNHGGSLLGAVSPGFHLYGTKTGETNAADMGKLVAD